MAGRFKEEPPVLPRGEQIKHPRLANLLQRPELLLVTLVFVLAVAYVAWRSEAVQIMRLNSSSDSIRCSAAEALAGKGASARKALPKLEAMLTNTACVHFSHDNFPDYVEIIGGIDPFINVMRTEQGSDSPKLAWWLRYHAHLYPQRTSDIVPLFIRGLRSQDPLVRHASAE